MIPRTLVPVNVRPVTPEEAKKTGHRTTTYMDDRTVIPSGPSDAPPLNGKSNIPAHFPLGVLVNRTLVERGMPAKPFEHLTPVSDTIPAGDPRTREWWCLLMSSRLRRKISRNSSGRRNSRLIFAKSSCRICSLPATPTCSSSPKRSATLEGI